MFFFQEQLYCTTSLADGCNLSRVFYTLIHAGLPTFFGKFFPSPCFEVQTSYASIAVRFVHFFFIHCFFPPLSYTFRFFTRFIQEKGMALLEWYFSSAISGLSEWRSNFAFF